MSAHILDNSQCDLNMYGPDPGDGSVKCTCDEDAPIEPAVGPPRVAMPRQRTAQEMAQFSECAGRVYGTSNAIQPGSVTLTGRKAALHAELEAATREYHAARQALTPIEQRWRKALDAYSEALLAP